MFLCHDSSFQKTISAFAFLRATITKASTLIYRTSTQQSINVPDEFGFLSPDIKEFGPGTLIKAKADLLRLCRGREHWDAVPAVGPRGFYYLRT